MWRRQKLPYVKLQQSSKWSDNSLHFTFGPCPFVMHWCKVYIWPGWALAILVWASAQFSWLPPLRLFLCFSLVCRVQCVAAACSFARAKPKGLVEVSRRTKESRVPTGSFIFIQSIVLWEENVCIHRMLSAGLEGEKRSSATVCTGRTNIILTRQRTFQTPEFTLMASVGQC